MWVYDKNTHFLLSWQITSPFPCTRGNNSQFRDYFCLKWWANNAETPQFKQRFTLGVVCWLQLTVYWLKTSQKAGSDAKIPLIHASPHFINTGEDNYSNSYINGAEKHFKVTWIEMIVTPVIPASTWLQQCVNKSNSALALVNANRLMSLTNTITLL